MRPMLLAATCPALATTTLAYEKAESANPSALASIPPWNVAHMQLATQTHKLGTANRVYEAA